MEKMMILNIACAVVAVVVFILVLLMTRGPRGSRLPAPPTPSSSELFISDGWDMVFPSSKPVGEFAQSFGVELRFRGEFYGNLERIIMASLGEDGVREWKHADLRGFEKFRACDFVKTLLENIQSRVALQFERDLLDAYINKPCVYNADIRGDVRRSSIVKLKIRTMGGDADAGTAAAEVHEGVDNAEDKGGKRNGEGIPANGNVAEKKNECF